MRKANISDMFKVARLINDMGLKQDIFDSQHGETNVEKIGFNAMYKIFEKATTVEVENEVYAILSAPFEMNDKEVRELDMNTFVKNFTECFDLCAIINFIKRAAPMVN